MKSGLKSKIEKNKEDLKKDGITEPYINNQYKCKTCNNIGKSHPVTSFCFVCGDDNWIPVNDEVGR